MTKPLATVPQIDDELRRAIDTRTRVIAEIADLMDNVAELDAAVDAMLDFRSRVAAT